MKKLLFSVLLLLAMAFGAVAQTEVTIGDGSGTDFYFPVNMFYNYSLTEQIYTAEEIGVAGTITSISYYYDFVNSFNLSNIKIYMMTTSKSSFSYYGDIVPLTDATLVYSGDFAASDVGWMTINLDDEFYYNGTDNLIVCIYDPIFDYPGSNYKFYYTTTSGYTAITYYSDTDVPNIDDLSSFGGNKEVFRGHSDIRLVIDVEENPACPKVRKLAVNNVTSSTANASWRPIGSESTWVLKYGTHGFDIETEGTTVELTSTSYTLEGLETRTLYDVYVMAVCGDDNESGMRMLTFETECEPIADFPWTEDFDSLPDLNFPDCWSIINNNQDDDYWYIDNYNPDNIQAAIYTDYNDGNNDDYLILPPFELDGNYGFSFDVRVESADEPNDYEVLLSTTSSSIEDFTVVLQPLETVNNTSFQRKNIPLPDYHGIVYVAIHVPQGGIDGWYLFLDNFELRDALHDAEIVDFRFPTRMAAPLIDSENATVTAIASYRTDLENLAESLALSVDAIYVENSATILDNEKTYTYTVTAEDRTTTKDWTVVVTKAESASTANDIVSFTFDNQVGESVIDTENKTVLAYAEWDYDLINPIIPNIEVSPMATISPESGTDQYFNAPVVYTVVAEDGESTANWTVTIINDPNACIMPYYIDIDNITATTASLAWYRIYTETSYLLKVSTTEMTDMDAEADVYDGTIAVNGDEINVDLTGLTAATTYFVYLQPNCSTDDWYETFFITECGSSAYRLPFVETFEEVSGSRQCWTIVDANDDNTTWSYDNMITGNGESAYYNFDSFNDANDWLISPKIAIVENAFLTFDYAVNSTTISERFSVYVMDDPENYETATQILATQIVNNDEFVSITDIDLSEYAGQDIYIGIKCESEADHYSFIVDNFNVLLPSYTITATAGENGTISPAELTVYEGEDAEFTIVANGGYRIASVMVDATNNVAESLVAGDGVFLYTFENVTADHTIDVTFEEIPTYLITVEVGENGNVYYNDVLASDHVAVYEGDTPEFVITPATNYQIAVLTVDENAIDLTPVQLGGYTYTFEPVTAAHTLSVTFELIPVTHTIVASAGEHGIISPSGNVDVTDGEDQIFSITPDGGYRVASVTVDAANVTESIVAGDGVFFYTFENVTADHTIDVTFEEIPAVTYTITGTVIGGHGTMDPDGEITVNEGSNYDVTFIPDEGYALDTVRVNGLIKYPVEGTGYITNNVYSLTNISENYTITVKYKDIRTYYNVHVELQTAGGDATPRDTSVLAGSDITIQVMPNEGYHISQLEIDGSIIGSTAINEISFRNVQADHHVKIAFFPNSVEENALSALSVYPNPNNGMFSINFSNFEGDATYQLIDARGAIIETLDINVANGATMNFNHNLDAGTYFVRIITGDKVYVEQIVVE